MPTSGDHFSNNSSEDLFLLTFSKVSEESKRSWVPSDSEGSSSSSDMITAISSGICCRRIESDREYETESDDENDIQEKIRQDINWRIPQGNQVNITFLNSTGIQCL